MSSQTASNEATDVEKPQDSRVGLTDLLADLSQCVPLAESVIIEMSLEDLRNRSSDIRFWVEIQKRKGDWYTAEYDKIHKRIDTLKSAKFATTPDAV